MATASALPNCMHLNFLFLAKLSSLFYYSLALAQSKSGKWWLDPLFLIITVTSTFVRLQSF